MKYLKKFENIKVDKRLGLYVDTKDIFSVIDFLDGRNIKFMLLFGTDDNDEACFLVLIEDYKKLEYDSIWNNTFSNYNDYYIEINGDNIYLNWFIPEEIEGEWQIIRNTDKETIKIIINSKKYNL
jgi:hypothetical protein